MHFQLFIPHVRGCDPAHLINIGLADFVANAEFMDSAAGPGPGTGPGGPGVIVAWRKPGQAQMGYRSDEQTWFKAAAQGDLEAGRFWVGFWTQPDKPPTPKDLARPYPQPGKSLTLGDGQAWRLPEFKQLDANLVLQDDGTWRFEPQRRFHAIWLEYVRWFERFAAAGPGFEFSFSEAVDFLIDALRINYRLLPEVASELRLFTKANVIAAMRAVMGIPDPPGADGVDDGQ